MMARQCVVQGCPNTTTIGSRCTKHERKKQAWVKVGKGGYGWAWQERRRTVLAQEPNCRVCGRPSTEVDHIVPRAEGGTESRANLRGICHRCHRIKTQREARRGRKRRGNDGIQ